jgi:hypothetical protein
MTENGNFLSQVAGFTPVIDALAREVGLVTAAVYGVVWRYCQMKDGVCSASLETIAEHVGLDRKTAERHVKKLCQKGYLKDLTPGTRNKSHVYVDTGRVKITGLVQAQVVPVDKVEGQTESPTGLEVGQRVLPGQTESLTQVRQKVP